MYDIYKRNNCVIFPLYEDDDYQTFCYWEIYACDCSSLAVVCECLDESEPNDTAPTLRKAVEKSRVIGREVRQRQRWNKLLTRNR